MKLKWHILSLSLAGALLLVPSTAIYTEGTNTKAINKIGGFVSNALNIDAHVAPNTDTRSPGAAPLNPSTSLVRATMAKSVRQQTFDPMLETNSFFTTDYAMYAWVHAYADFAGQTLRWDFRWIQPDGAYVDSISPWWTYGSIDAKAASWQSIYGSSLQLGQWQVQFWIQPSGGNWVYLTTQLFTLQSGTLCNQYVVNGGFESGSQGWQLSSNVAINSSFPHWGSQAAIVGDSNSQSFYLYQDVQVPATYSQSPVLALYFNIYSEDSPTVAYDFLHIQVRSQSGALLRTLDETNNLAYYHRSPPDAWQPFTWDLSDFAGQTIRIYISADTDSSLVTRWYIDDVSVTTCPLSQPETREERLAKRFSPVVFIHPNDIYWPNRVTVLLNDSQLKNSNNQVVVENPAETTFNGGQFVTSDYYLDIKNKAPNPITGDSQVYRDYYALLDRNVYPALLYAHVVDEAGQQALDGCARCTIVQYWFFYYFNDWLNKHEGDWEMIQVVVDQDRNDTPIRLAYAQHNGGTKLDWQHLSFHTGEHPWVFVGNGSHASYFSPGTYPQLLIFFPDETSGSGTVILPPNVEDANINRFPPSAFTQWHEPFPHLLSNGSPSWVDFQGTWGHDGWPVDPSGQPLGLFYAIPPVGPRYNSGGEKWNQPLEWMRSPSVKDDATTWPNANRALQARVSAGIDLHLYDTQNHHVGLNATGGVDLQIPGSSFLVDPGDQSQLIQVSPASLAAGYRLELHSHSSGTFDLAVGIADAATGASYGAWHTNVTFGLQTIGRVLLNQLPLTRGSGPQTAPNLTLQLDQNGDGIFETQVSPTTAIQSPLDTTPPAPITDLTATSDINRPNGVRLTWTAPVDIGGSKGVIRYDVRFATYPINLGNWEAAIQARDVIIPSHAGQRETYDITGLNLAQPLYFAVRSVDASFNESALSNLVSVQPIREYLPAVQR